MILTRPQSRDGSVQIRTRPNKNAKATMKRDAQHYVYLVQSEVAFSVNERFEKPADFATGA